MVSPPKNLRKNDEAVLKTMATNAMIYFNRNTARNFLMGNFWDEIKKINFDLKDCLK